MPWQSLNLLNLPIRRLGLSTKSACPIAQSARLSQSDGHSPDNKYVAADTVPGQLMQRARSPPAAWTLQATAASLSSRPRSRLYPRSGPSRPPPRCRTGVSSMPSLLRSRLQAKPRYERQNESQRSCLSPRPQPHRACAFSSDPSEKQSKQTYSNAAEAKPMVDSHTTSANRSLANDEMRARLLSVNECELCRKRGEMPPRGPCAPANFFLNQASRSIHSASKLITHGTVRTGLAHLGGSSTSVISSVGPESKEDSAGLS